MSAVLAIIPARGGSKGIPHKNLLNLCGKPLLAWTILQARQARCVTEVIVSSDSPEILKVAAQYGAIPVRRPDALATDNASSEEALAHAIDVWKRKHRRDPSLVVFLQATSPLREASDIDGAVAELRKKKADSLFSAAVLDDFCVWRRTREGYEGMTFDPWNRGRRQDREPHFLENGSIYIFRPHVLRQYRNRLGGRIAIYEMPLWKSYEIDKMEDVEICEYYFRKRLLHTEIAWRGAEQIRLVAYDFDGVMTDNRVFVDSAGVERVRVSRADGLGVGLIRKMGIRQVIISTETNPVVRQRAQKLGIDVIDSCRDKRSALCNYARKCGVPLKNTVFVGNDVNDLDAMKSVGFPVAPADAAESVREIAFYVTAARGGAGVVRELAERLREVRSERKS